MEENLNKHSNISAADLERLTKEANEEATPTTAKIIWDEFRADKPAMVALFIVVGFILFVMIASLFINTPKMMQTDIMNYNAAPGTNGFLLGADTAGRSVGKQLIVGARNSIGIALGLTVISSTFGICWGLISGYFNGYIDWGMQRVY
jgi:ABC-type dipeptide/oligopeptide/nickel transport systems, permease components